MGTYKTIKSAAQMAFQARKAIAGGDSWPFIPAFAFALAKDTLFDPLTIIPFVGIIPMTFSLFISVYLFVFLWGKGKWKVRLVIFFLSLVDAIPAVGIVPFSTICVWYALNQAKVAAKQAAKELPGLTAQTNAERMYEYQRTQAANDAQYQQEEAANDAQHQQTANIARQRVPLRNVV